MTLNENYTNDWQQIQTEMLKNKKWQSLFQDYQEIGYDEAQVNTTHESDIYLVINIFSTTIFQSY